MFFFEQTDRQTYKQTSAKHYPLRTA